MLLICFKIYFINWNGFLLYQIMANGLKYQNMYVEYIPKCIILNVQLLFIFMLI